MFHRRLKACANIVINLTRMIPGKHGEFAGIVTTTLDPAYFKPLLASVLYAADSRSSLVHSNGALFISAPETGIRQGMNLAVPGSFFSRHMRSGKAVTVFSGQLYSTREYRMIAQTTLPYHHLKLNSTLLVAVSRDLDRIFKHWRNSAIIQASCFMIFSVISLAILFFYQRSERKYAKIASDASHVIFQSEKLFRSTYDSAAIGMALVELTGRFMQANRALCQIVGFDETSLCQKTIQQITHHDDLQIDQSLMQELLTGQRDNYQIEKRFIHHNGFILWTLLTYSSLKDETGDILHLVVQIQDITEYKSLQEKLQAQANHDFLTGLPNRRYFMDRASDELARWNRYGGSLTFLMIDIDHFKRINDNYGHHAGDSVLQRFSELCKLQLRDIDLICRYGGEEFAVLLPETNLEQALEIAERLRASTASSAFTLNSQQSIHLTISIGVAVAQGKQASLERLLVKTDAALYNAKQSGRNKVSVAPSRAAC
ncbi:sensor domain-containing diguanylate cyclase [Methylophilus aquaticus]|uniref:diguanylate cyclase n=1 Tax=Methylophilus aquaticus TaxID=1971610 RepID=A0ABT9JWD1_9PROT|nr:diguanylate cyclase [Methylophilus aquaticus]MDP8568894.1 diguanylate cyclase [Methylophilus aquaticus]